MALSFEISSGINFGAQKVVLYGPEGIGKSSFAAQFPDPLFIDTEGSTRQMDVRRLPRPTSWAMLMQMIAEVAQNTDVCKTLVIDTVDWAERLCSEHVCQSAQKKSIEDFGYGKGYVLVKEEFGRMLNRLSDVVEKGINVVLTAHCVLRKFERPDESGAYDRWELKLGNKTGSQISALVKEWSDMLLFANYKETIIESGDTKRKKAYGGQRVMYTQHHPAWDAKNRYGLPPELPFDFTQIGFTLPNPPEECTGKPIEALKTERKAEEAAPSPPKASPEPQKAEPPAPKPKPEPKKAAPEPPAAKAKKPEPEAEAAPDSFAGIPKALADLMKVNNVTREEIEAAVSLRGYFPRGTPIENYPKEFVDGCLVGAWAQVYKTIENEIRNSLDIPF